MSASENFNGVNLTADSDGDSTRSLGSSPRPINGWTIRLLDAGGADAPSTGGTPSYLDVTGNAADSSMVTGGGGNALNVNGYFGVAVAAQFKATGGEEFWLQSFKLENNVMATGARLVGYRDGSIVATQDFTATSGGAITTVTPNQGADADWMNIDEFRIVQQNGTADIAFLIDDITVAAAVLPNAAPVATTSGGTTAFTEGANVASTPVVVDSGITVSDADNTTLASATVSITGGLQTGEDALAFTNNPATMGNISGSYNSGTGVLSLSSAGATATKAQWQAALQSVTYTNSSDSPNTGNRTISFVVNDGIANSNAAAKTVSVAAVNDTPVTTASGGSTAFTEGNNATSTPVAVDSGFTVTDGDNATLASATVSITGGFQNGEDALAFTNNPATMGNISGSYNAATGVMTLTSAGATATTAQWQAALRSVTYSNSSDTPNTGNRTVSLTTNDGTADGNTSTKTVTIASTNDTPVATASGGTTAFTEGANVTSTPVVVDTGITLSDVDSTTLASATVSITGGLQTSEDELAFTNNPATMGNISGSYNSATGVLSLSSAGATATKAQWQAALQSVTYTNSSDSPGTGNRTISFVVNDGSTNSAASTKTVSVAAANDVPVNTTSGGSTSFTAGGSGTNPPVAVDSSFTVTDGDNATLASATVSITGGFQNGEDELAFTNNPATMGNISASYNAATGVLTLTSAGATATTAQWQNALRSVTYTDTSTTPTTTNRTISFTTNDGTADSNTASKLIAMNVDLTNPTVTSVTSTKANGSYAGGTVIVQVVFSEAVTVTGTPQLTLETGAVDRVASYTGGSTTNTLTFTYSVQSGDNSADLDFQSTAALALNGGTIKDAAGNAANLTLMAPGAPGSLGANKAIVIDTLAPTLASSMPLDNATGVSASSNLTLTFSENVTAAEGLVTLRKTSDNSVVEEFNVTNGEGSLGGSVNISGTTLTLNPHGDLAYNTGYYLLAEFGIVKDGAGNYFDGIISPTALDFTTGSAPAPGGGGTTPPSTTVDGVPVTTEPGPGGSTIVTIPVVVPTRPDTPGTSTPLADIPLVTSPGGSPIVSVSVPTGVGLQAEGLTTTTTGSAALVELGFRIERIAGDNPELTNAGQVFYATLAPNEPLSVQILKPTIGAGYDASQPLVINGSSNPADGKQAVIVDARALPSGTVIQVDNIEFIAVVGNVRLVGGAGQNAASGDGAAQWIVLGPDDDVIHGGGGNDTVGSEAGDDQVYGDAGDDIVFGGAGNDLLSGGTGSDKLNGGTGFDVAIQEGARTDYTVTLEGAGIKLTHTASGVSDWLVDVEQVRFATGPSLTVAHSAAEEAAAFLFQKWIGRDLTQGEGAIIQSLTGQSAEQVATLFAQVFPTQAAGKTAAQLLEGMAAAGAIRVDAIREVTVTGDAGHNTISPTLGLARFVDGGAGTDTVVIPASLAQTHVQHNANGSYTLQRMTDGAMVDVTNVERVSFSDTRLALDLNGNAGQAAKLLGALAGPGILANKGIVGEVIRLLDAGASSQTIAGLGLQLLGASTPTQVAQTLWTNVTGRAGTDGELKILTDIMAGGTSAAELVVMAANLDMNATRIDLVGLAAKGLEFA